MMVYLNVECVMHDNKTNEQQTSDIFFSQTFNYTKTLLDIIITP